MDSGKNYFDEPPMMVEDWKEWKKTFHAMVMQKMAAKGGYSVGDSANKEEERQHLQRALTPPTKPPTTSIPTPEASIESLHSTARSAFEAAGSQKQKNYNSTLEVTYAWRMMLEAEVEHTCCLANYVVRPKEVEVWTIGAAIGVDEEECEISGNEYDEGSTDGSDFEDDLQFDKFINANVEYGGDGAGVGSNNEETECGQEVENEVVNGFEAGVEGETGNEATELVNALETGLDGLTRIEPVNGGLNGSDGGHEAANGGLNGSDGGHEVVNGGLNGSDGGHEAVNRGLNGSDDGHEAINGGLNGNDGGHEAVNEIYGDLDGLNEVQEDECSNLDDRLLETWDVIQIPWDVFENTQELPCDNTHADEETSCGNAKQQGLQVNDHGVKLSYGPPPKKKKKMVREESQHDSVSD
nr:putative delta-1-pyrroline-5-carboxylate synthase isoform X1 [Ipomoea batatas]